MSIESKQEIPSLDDSIESENQETLIYQNPFAFETNIPDSREKQAEEEEKEDYKRLFIGGGTTNRSTQDIHSNNRINEHKILFNVLNSENLSGRKKNRTDDKRRKDDSDNIICRQAVDFFHFDLGWINQLIDELDVNKIIEKRFLKIKHELAKNITKEKFANIIEKKLSEILSQSISNKYKFYEKAHNKNLCKEIEQKLPIMKKILEENYLTLFRNVYYPSKREINLKTMYGIDKTIYLSNKVKMFKDLIKKLKDNEKEDEYYIDKFKKVVNEYYFEGKLKFFS